MLIEHLRVRAARHNVLAAAKDLLAEAAERDQREDSAAADALVVAVLRVLDGYEAIAQLPDAHDIAREPDRPIPFHPVR